MKGELILRRDLGSAERRAMLALLTRHFEGVDPAQFERDLDEKEWVVRITDERGALAGFSTFVVERCTWRGEELAVVFSGDTIVDRRAWRSSALSRTWVRSVWDVHAADPRGRLVWLLLTSGIRTYRFLPVFWREFFPCFHSPTPVPRRELMHELARRRYGARFDAQQGIVRLAHAQVLRPELCAIPAERRSDPHLAFFAGANPGHVRGDELVCLTELSESNLTGAGRRMAGAERPAETSRV